MGRSITGNTHMWQCADGRSERSPLNKVEMLAKRVAGHARASLPPSLPDIHFVLGLLLFSNPQAHLRINDPHRNGRIMRLADAADALLEQDAQEGLICVPIAMRSVGSLPVLHHAHVCLRRSRTT